MKDYIALFLQLLGSWGSKIRKVTLKGNGFEFTYSSRPPDKPDTKLTSKSACMLIILAVIIVIVKCYIHNAELLSAL